MLLQFQILNYIIFRHSKVVEHYRWLSERSISSNKLVVYAQATINNNSMVTIAKFKQLVQSIPDDILRYFAHIFLLIDSIDTLISDGICMHSCTQSGN